MLFNQIETPQQLRGFVENGPDKFFFTPDTLRFFGDTMANYGVRHVANLLDSDGITHGHAVELFRRRPVNGGLFESTYFVKRGTDAARRVFVDR